MDELPHQFLIPLLRSERLLLLQLLQLLGFFSSLLEDLLASPLHL